MKFSRSRMTSEIWHLIETFFRARAAFQETYDKYETRVLQFAKERGVDRTVLRLDADEVSGLLDFKKLESMRNVQIRLLKNISHNVFRQTNYTDMFDRYVSQIYHELSILKEEQYKVSTFAREYSKTDEKEEYENILDEVHEAFPRKVHGISDLFNKAQARLEQLLPNFGEDKVFIRSLYIFGDELLKPFYPEGLADFYRIIYPYGGLLKAYLTVAKNFYASGFSQYARECLEKALMSPEVGKEGEEYERMQKEAEKLLLLIQSTPQKKAAIS